MLRLRFFLALTSTLFLNHVVSAFICVQLTLMKITEILDLDSIIADLKANAKRDVISELVDPLVKSGKIRDKNKLLDALIDRKSVV